jgi:hypothetical protein
MKSKQRIPSEAMELLARIEIAFRGVPRPRVTKHVARGLDDEWILSNERGQELSELDPEYNWEDVSPEDIVKFNEYFNFADAEGWRFYLPAYMSHYLRNYSSRHYNPVYLAYGSSPERLSLLTPEQRECVDDFVILCEED